MLNISDILYEKLRFESIMQKCSIRDVIQKRFFEVPFHPEVENAYQEFLEKQFNAMMAEEIPENG